MKDSNPETGITQSHIIAVNVLQNPFLTFKQNESYIIPIHITQDVYQDGNQDGDVKEMVSMVTCENYLQRLCCRQRNKITNMHVKSTYS